MGVSADWFRAVSLISWNQGATSRACDGFVPRLDFRSSNLRLPRSTARGKVDEDGGEKAVLDHLHRAGAPEHLSSIVDKKRRGPHHVAERCGWAHVDQPIQRWFARRPNCIERVGARVSVGDRRRAWHQRGHPARTGSPAAQASSTDASGWSGVARSSSPPAPRSVFRWCGKARAVVGRGADISRLDRCTDRERPGDRALRSLPWSAVKPIRTNVRVGHGPISEAAIARLAPGRHLRKYRFVLIDVVENHDIALCGVQAVQPAGILREDAVPEIGMVRNRVSSTGIKAWLGHAPHLTRGFPQTSRTHSLRHIGA